MGRLDLHYLLLLVSAEPDSYEIDCAAHRVWLYAFTFSWGMWVLTCGVGDGEMPDALFPVE